MKGFICALVAIISLGCAGWGGYGYPQYGGTMGYGSGYGGYGYVPPPPPGDLAFVEGHGYPNAYRNSHLVRVVNDTEWFVRVRMDGVDLSFADLYTGMPFLPPRTEGQFYATFAETDLATGCERHHFEFEAYLAPNFERPVVRSDRERQFCVGWEEQVVHIGGL